jgi:hypothetical protein
MRSSGTGAALVYATEGVARVEVIVAVGIVCWLAVRAQRWRERARDEAAHYQLSEGWVARWHHTHRGFSNGSRRWS